MFESFSKTKILATLGPSLVTKESLSSIIDAGVNGLRMNFSHSDYEYYKEAFVMIDQIRKEKQLPIPILLDLGGPKIRTGELTEKEIPLQNGETIEITIDEVVGTKDLISTSYEFLPKDAKVGDKILIDDGLIHLSIIEIKERSVVCKIDSGGNLKRRKGMNLPGMKLSTPSLTDKDKSDLEFAFERGVDFVALSFVRSDKDILELREWLKARGKDVQIIAKIEKDDAVDNFEKILAAADGIMVARGDLGVELKPQAVPMIQKNIIKRCNETGKLVITATQMLESMVTNPMPTRAEASDVANAVLDGTDVVMLSAETAAGRHPALVVKTMKDILLRVESESPEKKIKTYEYPKSLEENLVDAVGKAITDIAEQVDVKAIIALTHLGTKAVSISKFRPKAPIIALTNRFETKNILNLRWGIKSLFYSDFRDKDSAIKYAITELKEEKFLKTGDVVLFTSGKPYSEELKENCVRFIVVE